MITVKEHFEALRREDQKALILLSADLSKRLDLIVESFDELKTSVNEFHAAYGGQQKKGRTDSLILFNTITLILSMTLIGLHFWIAR